MLTGFGVEGGVELLGQAAFIYPLATLLGTFSFLPGGIGIAEGGIAGMLRATTGASAAVATARPSSSASPSSASACWQACRRSCCWASAR